MYNTTQTIAQLGKFMPISNKTELTSSNASDTTIEVNKYDNGTKTNKFSNWTSSTPHNNTLYAGSTYATNIGTQSTSPQNKIPPTQMKEANLAYVKAAKS